MTNAAPAPVTRMARDCGCQARTARWPAPVPSADTPDATPVAPTEGA